MDCEKSEIMNESLLKKVEEQEITARQFGFYWENLHQLVEQIRSECVEIEEAWQENDALHLEEEVGDLLQAAVGLAVFCKVDSEGALLKSIKKFQNRYDKVVQLAACDGYANLHQQPYELLMSYWNRAKNLP